MAYSSNDYENFKPIIGDIVNYPNQYVDFITASKELAQEIENAREGKTSLINNLTIKYASYNLIDDIDGGAVYSTADNSSTTTTLNDSSVNFVNANIQVGDKVVNINKSILDATTVFSTVVAVGTNSLTVTANNYTWANEDYSVGGKRCKNMAFPIENGDYATKEYLDRLSGNIPASISLVDTGALIKNDVVVVSPQATSFTGRHSAFYNSITEYAPVTSTMSALINENIWFDVSSGSFTINLPTYLNRTGSIISFADVAGTLPYDLSTHLEIAPFLGEKIMGMPDNDVLRVDEFTHISFSLIATGDANFGWAIINLQR